MYLKIKKDRLDEESYRLSQKEASIQTKSKRLNSKKTETEPSIEPPNIAIIDEKNIEDSPSSWRKEAMVKASGGQNPPRSKVNVYYEMRQQSIDVDEPPIRN